MQIVDAASSNADTFLKLGVPSAGTHVLTVQPGEMIEIVIQNDRAGLLGGEYASNSTLTSARNGREQHSFHLHGYHFWQVRMRAILLMGLLAAGSGSCLVKHRAERHDASTVYIFWAAAGLRSLTRHLDRSADLSALV